MINHRSSPGRILANERGVALPIAVLGLIAVSLMVTGALISSSTEMALTAAHVDGTQSLYEVDAAVEDFVRASHAAGTVTLGASTHTYAGAPYTMNVATLRSEDGTAGNQSNVTRTYSIAAARASGRGRRVALFVTATRQWFTVETDVNQGVGSGGGIANSGNSQISAFSDLCANENSLGVAVAFTNDVSQHDKEELDLSRIDGDTTTLTNVSRTQLIQQSLGNMTKAEFFRYATIKFGYDDNAQFPSSAHPSSFDYGYDNKLNWGCPRDMVTCDAGSPNDSTKVPIIAIEAGGATIDLQGDHGQGILYVHNGSVKITGQFLFKGIIIVEAGSDSNSGRFEIAGTGAEGTKIEGALIATGGVKDSRLSGNAVVNYNMCAVDGAEAALNAAQGNNTAFTFATTHSWMELVQ